MRWWSVANFVSNAGTWMQLTVQNLLVLQITGSAAATGLSMSVQAGPALFMSLLGGAAVDRWSRKLTAAVSQTLLGAVAFVTAVLVALDRLDMTSLLVLAAVTGTIATVDGPACALLGNDLVPVEDVPAAIGIGALVHSAGRLVGTAPAGVTVGFLGTAAAYAANGMSFLFVAAVVPCLRPAPGAVPATGPDTAAAATRSGAGSDTTVRGGLRFLAGRRRLVALAGITGISAVFGRNYGLTLAVLVTGPLAGGAGAFGTVSAVLAVGGILGAFLGARLRRPPSGWWACWPPRVRCCSRRRGSRRRWPSCWCWSCPWPCWSPSPTPSARPSCRPTRPRTCAGASSARGAASARCGASAARRRWSCSWNWPGHAELS
jgi:MFS family permease